MTDFRCKNPFCPIQQANLAAAAACLPRSRALLVLLSCILIFASAGLASADIYRYVDEHGIIHFSNVPTDFRYRLYLPSTRMSVRVYLNRYDTIIRRAARDHGVDFSLVKAVIKAESDFDSKAVSVAGAQGLMQLMPETAAELEVQNPFDPHENIQAGVRYLKRQLNNFKNDVSLALAAYNAGEAAVKKYGRIPPFEQTRTFVDRVLRYWDEFKLHHQRKR